MRIRVIILVTAVLLFSAVIFVPQIIEAKRAKSPAEGTSPSNSVINTPIQGRKQPMTVGQSIRNDTSLPAREMKQQPVFKPKKEANLNPKVAHFHKDAPDRVVQKSMSVTDLIEANMPSTLQNFNGMQFPGVACNCAPPDTNGEVGATQYVQTA